MKQHIYKIRFIIVTITIFSTIGFFTAVLHQNNSDNIALRQLGLRMQYQWYTLFHKNEIINEATSSRNAQGIPVLLYHGITNVGDRFSGTEKQFAEQMFALKQAGYNTITPEELVSFLKEKKPIPEKSFLLTFDDGRKDSYYGADPILHFLGFKAVMFIATHQSLDEARSDYYLSQDELSYMIGTGRWFIESHARQNEGGYIIIDKDGTKGNFLSNLKWLPEKERVETVDEYRVRVTDELVHSKEQIENTFHTKVSLFSYPFGDYGAQSKNFKNSSIPLINSIITKTYAAAFHQVWPIDYNYLYNKPTDDPSLLKRLEPAPTLSGADLVKTLELGSPKILPFTDNFSSNLGWKHSWGASEVVAKNKSLVLSAGENNQGAFTYLDGSSVWEDYLATVHINATFNSDVSIAARFVNENNYVDCFYSNGTVQIRNKHDGVINHVSISKNNFVFAMSDALIGIVVSHNTVACLLNNREVVRAPIVAGDIAIDGGVGVGMWSHNPNATVVFETLHVAGVANTIDGSVAELAALPLAILAGETTYTDDTALPKEYPKYSEEVVRTTLKEAAKYDFIPKPATDNLVKNPFFTETTNGIPLGWSKNVYGDTEAVLSFDPKIGLSTTVKTIGAFGQAGWYFAPVPVSPNEEYIVSGEYTSTTPVLFVVEYKMANGKYQQDRMSWLIPTTSTLSARGVVRVPDGAKEMTAYFMLETPGTVTIKNISLQKLQNGEFSQGMVTLNFDDGFATSYSDVFPLLKNQGLTATHYIVSDYVGYPRYMTENQIRLLQKSGEEIGSHTVKHPRLTLLTLDNLVNEIVGSKKSLESMGFTISTFDYPYGSVNNFVRAEVIKAGYKGARSTLRGFNTKNTDPFMLRDQHIDKDTTFSEVKNYIDKAVAEKTWLVLEFHDTVSKEEGVGEAINPKLLSQIIAYIKQVHIQGVTMKQGLTLMKQ